MSDSTLSEDELKRFGYDLCILTITLTENYPICLKNITLMFDTLATNLAIDVYPLHLEEISSQIKEIENPRFLLNNPGRKYKKFSENLQKPLRFNENELQHIPLINFLNRIVLKSTRITNIYEKLKSGYFANFSKNAHSNSTENSKNSKKEHTPYFDQLRKVVLSMLNDTEPFTFSIDCLKVLFDSFLEYKVDISQNQFDESCELNSQYGLKKPQLEVKRIYFKDYIPYGILHIYNLLLLLRDVRDFLEQIPAPEAFLLNGMKRREMLSITGTFLDYINKIGQMSDNFQKYCLKNNYLAKIYTNNVLYQTWCLHSNKHKIPNITYKNLRESEMINLEFLQKKEPLSIFHSQCFKKKADLHNGASGSDFDERLFFEDFVRKNIVRDIESGNKNHDKERNTKSMETHNSDIGDNHSAEEATSSDSRRLKDNSLFHEYVNDTLPYQYPKITSFLNDSRFYRFSNYTYLITLLRILGFSYSRFTELSMIRNLPQKVVSIFSSKITNINESKFIKSVEKKADISLSWSYMLIRCDFEASVSMQFLDIWNWKGLESALTPPEKYEDGIYKLLETVKHFGFSYAYTICVVLISFNTVMLSTSCGISCDKNFYKKYLTEKGYFSDSKADNDGEANSVYLKLYGARLIAAYASHVCSTLFIQKIKSTGSPIAAFYSLFVHLMFTDEEMVNHAHVMTSLAEPKNNNNSSENILKKTDKSFDDFIMENRQLRDTEKVSEFLLGPEFRSFLNVSQFLSFRLLSLPSDQQEWLALLTYSKSITKVTKNNMDKELDYIILKDDDISRLNSYFWSMSQTKVSENEELSLIHYRRDLISKIVAMRLNKLNVCYNRIINIVKQDPGFLHNVYDGSYKSNIENVVNEALNDGDSGGSEITLKQKLDHEITEFCTAFVEYKQLTIF